MKFILTLLVFCCACALSQAQSDSAQVIQIDTQGVNVYADFELDDLLKVYKEVNRIDDTRDGYRIQIYYSNDMQEVNKAKSDFYMRYPDMVVYVQYEAPYHKIRVGDYATRLEATRGLQDLLADYQSAFVVESEIKIK